MRKLCYLLAILSLGSSRLRAQQPVTGGQQPVSFIYATGQRTDQRLKVLIISTHILRAKNYAFPYQRAETSMSLDFYKIINQIEHSERYFSADYDNIHFNPVQQEDLYGDYLNWHKQLPYHEDITSSDNTLSAIEKVRASLIEDHIRKGYRVYQVRFVPDIDGDNSSGYRYYDEKTTSYKTLELERVSPLSPLWIAPFVKGDIKNMLAGLKPSSSSNSSAGLVIEDTKTSNKNSSSDPGTTTKANEDPDKWKKQAEFNMWQAGYLELQGDSLYQRGALFYPQALQKYQQAQQLYPSARVQSKINNINGLVAGVQAITQLGESVENAIESADPDKKTRHVYGFVNYTGLLGSYSNMASPYDQHPMGAFFGVNGHRTFLSFEIRIGYMASPVFEYTVEGTNDAVTGDRVSVQQSGAGLGLSGGLNIPFRNLVVYGMYGLDMRVFNISNKVLTPGFLLKEDPEFPAFVTRWTFGAVYKIPRTRIGVGIQYNLHSIKGEEDESHPLINNKYPDEHYYLSTTTNERYKFNNAGISFCWEL